MIKKLLAALAVLSMGNAVKSDMMAYPKLLMTDGLRNGGALATWTVASVAGMKSYVNYMTPKKITNFEKLKAFVPELSKKNGAIGSGVLAAAGLTVAAVNYIKPKNNSCTKKEHVSLKKIIESCDGSLSLIAQKLKEAGIKKADARALNLPLNKNQLDYVISLLDA